MKSFYFIPILLIFCIQTASSTELINNKELNKLDSLIINDQFEKVTSFLEFKKSILNEIPSGKEEKKNTEFIINNYAGNLNQIKSLYLLDNNRLFQLQNTIKNSKKNFNIPLAGERAVLFFRKSEENRNSNLILALKYYYL